jgi:hypothetical protein
MKFCPGVPEICRGQVHVPQKERRRRIIRCLPFSKWLPKHGIKKWVVKIQHCPISSKFYMWVDNDVQTLKNFYLDVGNQFRTLKSNNVEFVRHCGGHFENGDR